MQANEIYQEVKKLMSNITPLEAKEAFYFFKLYDSMNEYYFFWLLENGNKGYHGFENELAYEIMEQIREMLVLLQKDIMFKNKPWTHCKITLSDKGEFNIEFADIPHEDSWPGLFLKRVSELNQQEAYDEYGVPKREWKKRKILYGKES